MTGCLLIQSNKFPGRPVCREGGTEEEEEESAMI